MYPVSEKLMDEVMAVLRNSKPYWLVKEMLAKVPEKKQRAFLWYVSVKV